MTRRVEFVSEATLLSVVVGVVALLAFCAIVLAIALYRAALFVMWLFS